MDADPVCGSSHSKPVFKQSLIIDENNINLSEIDNIFVNQGPGKFSRIRASIAVAKALSVTNRLNLYGFKSEDIKDMNYISILKLYEKVHLTKNLINPFYLS